MITLRTPDGSEKQVEGPVAGTALATEHLNEQRARELLALKVDGELWDADREVPDGATVEFVERKDEDALELIRHDAAHLLAQAVQDLYPGTQVTIGPVIDDGFYYDFARDEPFSTEDLERIEKRMSEIVEEALPTRREVWERDRAVKHFEAMGERYKAEIINALPAGEEVKIYFHGDWHDLCRGPHLPTTKHIGKGFKLTKVAGAYWRGDHRNPMLQRIYGTAWRDKKELKAYLQRLEEAERRDHRRLGREMDLFHVQEEGPGSIFWHPKGWTLFQNLIEYMRMRNTNAGYREINTPDVLDYGLWERSGHAEKFGENMFSTVTPDERKFALKPMNCPGHVQVFNAHLHSYRELPMRLAEFGKVHRYEPSGALHGMMRVRHFTQDDAHVFCTPDQLQDECVTIVHLILDIYREFGFEDVHIKFSDRPEKRVGEDEVWDRSEAALKAALDATGLPYGYNPGEGAFYGPKLEFVLRDAIGRDWQCGTLQVDFNLPERLDANYMGEDGIKHRPVMLHRALFGSLERFTGILIEHHAGRLPLWLAPVQAVVATITSDADPYALEAAEALRAAGLRVETDLRNEKIGYKVREHSNAKVPAVLVVGRKEAEERAVAVRRLGSRDNVAMSLDEAVAALCEEARTRAAPPASAKAA